MSPINRQRTSRFAHRFHKSPPWSGSRTIVSVTCKEGDLWRTAAFEAVTQFEAGKSRLAMGSYRVSPTNKKGKTMASLFRASFTLPFSLFPSGDVYGLSRQRESSELQQRLTDFQVGREEFHGKDFTFATFTLCLSNTAGFWNVLLGSEETCENRIKKRIQLLAK